MNRTIKEATVKRYNYDDLESFKAHVLAFVTASQPRQAPQGIAVVNHFQDFCDAWTKDPSIFEINLHHLISGPHI